MTGKLYIVATPIGNLADITLRALSTLKEVDLIASEDTRVSQKLLAHYEIKTKLVSYHQHSRDNKIDFLIQELAGGKSLALITDAGTPGIADPGNKFIDRAKEKLPDLTIVPVPGPSALIAALSIAGLPTDRFSFFGFLPHKKGKETILKKIAASEETTVFYESTHRILKTLEQLAKFIDPKRKLVVCRELTKKFETTYRGNVDLALAQLKKDTVKGEFVVVVAGKS